MSYSPYQQGQQPGVPYPQQSCPPPNGGAPYPTPPYPTINPNALGYNSNTPMYMPQPMPLPTYPPTAPASNPPFSGGYPSATGDYPPTSGGYPPSTGGYPPSRSEYPPSRSEYPPSRSEYPPSRSEYPPSSGGYAPSSSPYSSPSKSPYSSTQNISSYPPGTYSPTSNPYPPSTGSYPPPGRVNQTHMSPHHAPGASPGGHGQDYQRHKGLYGGVSYAQSGSSTFISGKPKRTPTVVPANPFNPRADAEILRKAMKGFGTDEKAIINVLAYRTNVQRLQIAVEFKTLYGKDLVKDLKSECTGNFENLLVAMMTPLPEFYAQELHDAIQGLGTDEDVLIEIMCTKSNQEIMIIRQAYHSRYFRSLEEDLMGDTSGTFKRLMVSLCNAGRDESMVVSPDAARADAQALLRAGELRLGTDESTFNSVLCQRNYAQLQLIFQEYQHLTGHDIEKAIKNEFSGNGEQALLAIIRSIKNQSAFFAKLLNKSMKGMGTNDRDLIRLVVTRSEIDMVEIKREYQVKYGESLADAIKGDCSGDYKKCILHLIGEA